MDSWERRVCVSAAGGAVKGRIAVSCDGRRAGWHGCKIGRTALGIVRPVLELIVAGAGARAAQVCGGIQLRIAKTISAIEVSGRRRIRDRTPRKSSMHGEDTAKGPTAGDLLHPVIAAMEEDGLPQGDQLESLADIVVRASVVVADVEGIGLLEIRSGTGVEALGPGEFRVGRELVGELMAQAG